MLVELSVMEQVVSASSDLATVCTAPPSPHLIQPISTPDPHMT